MCVRNPAALPALSRSTPTSAPNSVAAITRNITRSICPKLFSPADSSCQNTDQNSIQLSFDVLLKPEKSGIHEEPIDQSCDQAQSEYCKHDELVARGAGFSEHLRKKQQKDPAYDPHWSERR